VHDPLGIRERVDRDDPVVHHGEADDRNGLAVKRDHGARPDRLKGHLARSNAIDGSVPCLAAPV
jgi:hypothetical protein